MALDLPHQILLDQLEIPHLKFRKLIMAGNGGPDADVQSALGNPRNVNLGEKKTYAIGVISPSSCSLLLRLNSLARSAASILLNAFPESQSTSGFSIVQVSGGQEMQSA